MYGYIAFYDRQRYELYASSLLEAKQKALEHFKPPKKKVSLVSVVLAEVDGQPVTHVPTE